MEASRRKRNGLMGGGFFGTNFKKTWTNISPISLEEYSGFDLYLLLS
jgi:hypothetical protein